MSPSLVVAVVAGASVVVVLVAAAYAAGVRSGAPTGRARSLGANELDLLRGAVSRLATPVLVVTADGRVVHRSDEADRLGMVRGGFLAHAELRRLAREALADPAAPLPDEAAEGLDLSLPRGPVGDGHLEVRVRRVRLERQHLLLDVENRGEALRVEDVRRDFVVNVSHELKTPVGAIGVLAETLEDAADDPEAVRRFAARIRSECERLQVLVADVLELSRVQVVDGVVRHDDVALDDVVTDALDQVRERAGTSGIQLSGPAASGAVVVGDRELLTTAVRNLLVNAIAYSPERTQVSLSVGRRDGLVLVQVTDRGIGIPVPEQERVFERFYRVDPARSRRTGGTGLGLAIVKHVVDNHGGDVQLWSRPGHGSTFTIRLPEGQVAAAAGGTGSAPTPTGGPQ